MLQLIFFVLQMSSELIERALYAMESSFHPLFNLAVGTSRLDYRRQENRSEITSECRAVIIQKMKAIFIQLLRLFVFSRVFGRCRSLN